MTASAPQAPALSRDDYRHVAVSAVGEIRRDDVPSLAAGVAFKMFLSIFPALLAAVALFGLVTDEADLLEFLARVDDLLPAASEFLEAPLQDLVDSDETLATSAVILGALGGIWAATSAAVTLMRALSRAYNVEETRRFAAQRVIALALTAALFVALLSMFALLVVGGSVEEWFLDRLRLIGAAETSIEVLLTVGRYLLAVGVLMVLFAFVYWIGPDRERRPAWGWITPGAVIGVVGWIGLSLLFSVYTAVVQPAENPAYATVGSVIVFLLWLQLSMMALLTGAEVNSELNRAKARKRDAALEAGFGANVPPMAGLPPALESAAGDRLAATSAAAEPGRLRASGPAGAGKRGRTSSVVVAAISGLVGFAGYAAGRFRRDEPEDGLR